MSKWVFRLFLSAIGMVAIAVSVYAFNTHREVADVTEDTYVPDVAEDIYIPHVAEVIYTPDVEEIADMPTEAEEVNNVEVDLLNQDPISILLLGVDIDESAATDQTEQGMPDSIIIITVNPADETTKMVSIPRDTRTEIVGMYFDDKINHAYAFGGIEMMINSVQNLLDIPVNYYVRIDMGGFQALVDVVGGVEVENDLDFAFDGTHFPLGTVQLDGADALKFSRMRMEDPRGDFGRQQRQRLIIGALINELTSVTSITQFANILDTLREHLETNITFDNAATMLFGGYREAFANIEQLQLLTGEGQIINGIYYQVLSYEEITNTRMIFRTHLGLAKVEEVLD